MAGINLFFVLMFLRIVAGIVNADSPSELWNAALKKPAFMKSTYRIGTAEKAVDGSRRDDFYGKSCIHSAVPDGILPEWWMVDLTEEYLVHEVIITNRIEFSTRLKNTTVDLFLTDPRDSPSFPTEPGILCAKIVGPLPNGTYTYPCPMPTWARYVKITKYSPQELHVCEVEVMVGDGDYEQYQGKAYQEYRRFKNSELQDGSVLATANNAKSQLGCSVMCATKKAACTAFHWTEATKFCQLLAINSDSYGPLSVIQGTDLYVRKGTDS